MCLGLPKIREGHRATSVRLARRILGPTRAAASDWEAQVTNAPRSRPPRLEQVIGPDAVAANRRAARRLLMVGIVGVGSVLLAVAGAAIHSPVLAAMSGLALWFAAALVVSWIVLIRRAGRLASAHLTETFGFPVNIRGGYRTAAGYLTAVDLQRRRHAGEKTPRFGVVLPDQSLEPPPQANGGS